jgi:mannitol-specific phosphotransferase system IIBC component
MKYMFLSCHLNAGQILDIKVANRCIENVPQFRYLETTITNPNLIHEEIKRILNSGSACYYSVQNFLSSRLLSEDIKIRIHKTVILPVVLYGCETWPLTLREKHRCLRTRC